MAQLPQIAMAAIPPVSHNNQDPPPINGILTAVAQRRAFQQFLQSIVAQHQIPNVFKNSEQQILLPQISPAIENNKLQPQQQILEQFSPINLFPQQQSPQHINPSSQLELILRSQIDFIRAKNDTSHNILQDLPYLSTTSKIDQIEPLEKSGVKTTNNCLNELICYDKIASIVMTALSHYQAVPIRLKILMEKFFQNLPQNIVNDLLQQCGWNLEDFTRGYMLNENQKEWECASLYTELNLLQLVALTIPEYCELANTLKQNSIQSLLYTSTLIQQQQNELLNQSIQPTYPDEILNKTEAKISNLLKKELVENIIEKDTKISQSQLVTSSFEEHENREKNLRLEDSLKDENFNRVVGTTEQLNLSSMEFGKEEKNTQDLPGVPPISSPYSSSTTLKFNEQENEEDDSLKDENSETKSYFLDSDNPELPDQQFDDVIPKFNSIKKSRKFAKSGKRRVECPICSKTYCDKGALKIHTSAVHLKEMHRCTIDGCDKIFSSRRSRNRHSGNPNMHAAFSGGSGITQIRTTHSPLSITSPASYITSSDEKTSTNSIDFQRRYSFETSPSTSASSINNNNNNNVLSLFSLAQLHPQQLMALAAVQNNNNKILGNRKRKCEKTYKFDTDMISSTTKIPTDQAVATPFSILTNFNRSGASKEKFFEQSHDGISSTTFINNEIPKNTNNILI